MSHDLQNLLKRHFGFDAFRPHQEAIIRDILAGRDTFALLPTGGGKSLCFQLPALAFEGGLTLLSPIFDHLNAAIDYGRLRLFRAARMKNNNG